MYQVQTVKLIEKRTSMMLILKSVPVIEQKMVMTMPEAQDQDAGIILKFISSKGHALLNSSI